MGTALAALLILGLCLARPAAAAERIVAAEGVYADIARQVGGPEVQVTSILDNPAGDPHLYEATPSAARAVAGADLLIENGIGYDPWMARLIAASPHVPGDVIVVADLLHRQPGDNPHLWYDPASMPALVRALAARLAAADPAGAGRYAARRTRVLADLAELQARIGGLRARHAGTPVAATEPVFGLMILALGLVDRHAGFERAVMNGTEPPPSEVAALQDDLRHHRVRLLITNRQASDPAATRLLGIAAQAGIPTLPITETLPAGRSYQAWIGDELTALDASLSAAPAAGR
jgi:zinc/manganese transport system substrate-binding protein